MVLEVEFAETFASFSTKEKEIFGSVLQAALCFLGSVLQALRVVCSLSNLCSAAGEEGIYI